MHSFDVTIVATTAIIAATCMEINDKGIIGGMMALNTPHPLDGNVDNDDFGTMICPPVSVAILAIVLVALKGARQVVAIRVLAAVVDL